MANPQKENGYTPIANELLDRLYQLNLNGTQFKIVLLIFRYTYGFNRKSHELSLNFVSNAINSHKNYVSEELIKLIKNKIILVKKEAGFSKSREVSINKNYDEWCVNVLQSHNHTTVPQSLDTTVPQSLDLPVPQSLDQDKQDLKQNIKKDILSTSDKKTPSFNYQSVVDIYNSICVDLPKVKVLTDKRKTAIKSIRKTVDEKIGFEKLFEKVQASDFLCGRGKSNWDGCGFDWIIKNSNAVKIIEGNYDNRGGGIKQNVRGEKIGEHII